MSASISGRRSTTGSRSSSSMARPAQPSCGHWPAGMMSPGNTRSQKSRSSLVFSTGPVQPQSRQVAVSVLLMAVLLVLKGIGGAGGIRTREAAPST